MHQGEIEAEEVLSPGDPIQLVVSHERNVDDVHEGRSVRLGSPHVVLPFPRQAEDKGIVATLRYDDDDVGGGGGGVAR